MSAEEPPESVHGYRLGHALGSEQSPYLTCLAVDQEEATCVVKQIRPGLEDRDDLKQRLRQEFEVLSRLASGCVPTPRALLEDPIALVTDYIDGAPLAWRLNPFQPGDEPLGLLEKIQITNHLLETVAEVHQAGVVHRDIKPSNVIVDAEGVGWLTDFGVACLKDAPSSMGEGWVEEAAGTWPYSAPELRTEPTSATGAGVDVYGLGTLMFEMFAGRAPPGEGAVDSDVPGVPALLAGLIQKAMAQEPKDRYTSVHDMKRDFGRAAAQVDGSGTRSVFATALLVSAWIGALLIGWMLLQ